MVIESRLADITVLALCAVAAACHRNPPLRAIDPSLASCIPAGATLLAGVDLDQLRASALYRKLPPAALALIEPLRGASYLIVASDGANLTAIARGAFREAPAGTTLIAPGLAISGTPDAAAAATAQHRAGTIAATELLAYAEPIAAANPIWGVARGSATLPLTGNLANLNNFLRATVYTTAAARIGDRLSIEAAGVCRTSDDAAHLERTIRAFLSLASIRGGGPGPVSVNTQDLTVRVTLSADAADAERLLR